MTIGAVGVGVLTAWTVWTATQPRRRPVTAAEIHSAESGWNALGREIARARRHGLKLSIARFPAARGLAAVLMAAARESDVVWADDDRAVYVLLPEVGPEGADYAATRLCTALAEAGVNNYPALASFPDEGVTFGALLAVLDGKSLGPGRNGLRERGTTELVDSHRLDLRDTRAELTTDLTAVARLQDSA